MGHYATYHCHQPPSRGHTTGGQQQRHTPPPHTTRAHTSHPRHRHGRTIALAIASHHPSPTPTHPPPQNPTHPPPRQHHGTHCGCHHTHPYRCHHHAHCPPR